jgi:GNAT superfamily N-acetyltransferase
MDSKWRPKWYEAGDESGILDLRNKVFVTKNVERARMETWLWQFRDNPAGPGIIRFAMDDKVFAGQYAVIPTRFCIRGKETPAALSCDTMVNPDYQRLGIFTALARDVYRKALEMGIELVWGFPNENSHHGFKKNLQWFDIATLPTYVRPLRFTPLLQYFLKNRFAGSLAGTAAAMLQPFMFPVQKVVHDTTGDLKIEKVLHADAAFNGLWNANKAKYPILQVRDAAYVNWRYFGLEPDMYEVFVLRRGGAMEGFIVMRRAQFFGVDTAVVADIFPADLPAGDFSFAMEFCASHSLRNGCALMVFLCTALADERYRQCRFMRVPQRFEPKQFNFGARCEANPDLAKLAHDISNWYITFGDTDLV